MSATNIITGRTGRFVWDTKNVSRLTQFSPNPTLATSSEWGDSESGGYTNRAVGRQDCTFTAEGKYDTSVSVIRVTMIYPGECKQAVLWMKNDANEVWEFTRALCTDFNMVVDVDSEEVVGWSGSFGADGEFFRPGQMGGTPGIYP